MASKRGKAESDGDSAKEDKRNRGNSHPRESSTATLLSVIAVVLSAVALVAAFALPKPGNIMNQHSVGGPFTIGSACTHYPRAEVSISVPGAGTIVVSATVGVGINHTFGISDTALIVIAASATECTVNNYTAWVSFPYSLPSDPYHFTTVPILRAFSVNGPATVTFYVNGIMTLGADAGDRFDSASLVAVYYPR